MPRQPRARRTERKEPYSLRPALPMGPVRYSMPGHMRFDSWESERSDRSSRANSATYSHRQFNLPPIDPNPPHSATSINQPITPSQSGPWTAEEDEILLRARAKSMPWERVHTEFFPYKTSNACRKRYERLVQKRKANEWDPQRLEAVALSWRDNRERMWKMIADPLGERWDHVEKVCMDRGIKTLTNIAASHTRVRQAAHRRSASINHHHHQQHHLITLSAVPVSPAYPHTGYDDPLAHDDSGIALSVSGGEGSRRSSGSGGGVMPGWNQILQ